MLLHWKPKKHPRLDFTLGGDLNSFRVFPLVISGMIYGNRPLDRAAEFSSSSLAAQAFATQKVGVRVLRAMPRWWHIICLIWNRTASFAYAFAVPAK